MNDSEKFLKRIIPHGLWVHVDSLDENGNYFQVCENGSKEPIGRFKNLKEAYYTLKSWGRIKDKYKGL